MNEDKLIKDPDEFFDKLISPLLERQQAAEVALGELKSWVAILQSRHTQLVIDSKKQVK